MPKPHAHVMLTMRAVDERGFGRKVRDWNRTEVLVRWRERWAELANEHLAELDIDARIDHRSLEAQGIGRSRSTSSNQVANAWLLYAQGNSDEAVKIIGAAADAEDRTEKAPVTPGPLAPARELYGAMLLERGAAAEALTAFEATLKKEPHRFNAGAGAAMAAAKLGENAKAKAYYEQLVALAEGSDAVRHEIAAARTFLATHGTGASVIR